MLGRNAVMSDRAEDAVAKVCRALARGRLRAEGLTARELGAFVGKTTSVLYHHWGSLDGFLHAVGQAGFVELGGRLEKVLADGGDLPDVAEAFVRFGLECPALYYVMFERRYDWKALRKRGAFEEALPGAQLWQRLTERVAATGADDPDLDARLFFAGLHGLVSLASSGRANVGTLARTDRDVALAAARRLAVRLSRPVREGEST